LIGFSDITVLHSAINGLGISSIHAIMAKHLTELAPDSDQVLSLKNTLFGTLPHYQMAPHTLNRKGEATGRLIGGNLSVFSALRGTQFDLPFDGNILFVEDIAENPYHIDRMMQNLRMGGALSKISGLIVGQFSDCEEDPSMKQTIAEIILSAVSAYNYPVYFNFPSGHVDYNLSLILGAKAHFKVDSTSISLRYDNF
jgi:muramoyltetrapeptide carboxypeptidase